MRILLVSGSLAPLPCGVGDYTLRLAQALAAIPGLEVGILTSRGAAADPTGKIQVFPLIHRWHLSEASAFRTLVRQWLPDVVHIQYPTQGYGRGALPTFIPLLAWSLGAGVVRTWHEVPGGRSLLSFFFEAAVPGPYVVVRGNFERLLNPLARLMIFRKRGLVVESASTIPRSLASAEGRRRDRQKYLEGKNRLIVFFGFLYPFKRVELLFDIANPITDRIVIAGEAGVDRSYLKYLQRLADEPPWQGSVTLTGFLSNAESADLLAAADAVVLPLRAGAGNWNTSIHAAVLQGTAVITTSKTALGLDPRRNIYFAAPDDVTAMTAALDSISGTRRPFDPEIDRDEWQRIAQEHQSIYKTTRTVLHHQGPAT